MLSMTSAPFENSTLPDPLEMLRALVALPGPPGQEGPVRDYLITHLAALGLPHTVDAKGNLLAAPSSQGVALPDKPRVVVTAHLDEIALVVTGGDVLSSAGGALSVAPLGGALPWKWGEGPVQVLLPDGTFIQGVLGFGSIHTTALGTNVQQARDGNTLGWEGASVVTGLSQARLEQLGIHPGLRVVIDPARRTLTPLNDSALVASYFLDDRADLVAWLLALEELHRTGGYNDVLFAATTSEEVGGEGARYLLGPIRPEICVALEIGPSSPDAPFPIDRNPTVWVNDSYAAMSPRDLALVSQAAKEAGLEIHWQNVTRGGSDATCAAANGLCARPVTLAFAAENSHGFEIMHKESMGTLVQLLVGYLRQERTSPP